MKINSSLKYFLLLSLWCYANSYAQIFSWKNSNLSKDSIKKDSVLVKINNSDFFSRDTLNFAKKEKKIWYDEGVIVNKIEKKDFFGNIKTKGNIIRGLTFGNNQGQSLQSSMNLQFSGNINKDISIFGTISDTNLPFQADGYTQTLREFDKILLEITIKDSHKVNAGYLDLNNDYSYFGKYQRRSMGLQYLSFWKNKGTKTETNFSAGIARSNFHRMRFQGMEGNQGPYRLYGVNGETFIVIISGSEQVFIDGILMKRGENNDYVINYNTGEVTFTSFRPIYRQNFITISYNYTNRNYTRFIVTGGVKHEREKFKIAFNAFIENDNKEAPLSFNLTQEEKQILVNAGNDPDKMYASSAVIAEYNVNHILYRRLQNSSGDYYEYSTDSKQVLYQLAFTYFGAGNGDYRFKQSTNNGRIFEFVGVGKGDYRAVRKLAAPEKSQVFSTALEYVLTNGKIGADFSLSNRDYNLFSEKNDNQNIGYAGRFWGNTSFSKNQWKGILGLEMLRIDKDFHILDRINSVEFSRDFNLQQEFNKITQNRLVLTFNNQFKNKNFINYRVNYIDEKTNYQGLKNELSFDINHRKSLTKGQFSHLTSKSEFQNTEFIRGGLSSEYITQKGSWQVGGSLERNLKKINSINQYQSSSFSWREVFLQKKLGDSLRTKLLSKVYYRENDSVRSNRLENNNKIIGMIAQSEIIKKRNTVLNTLLHYRKLYDTNPLNINQNQNKDYILGNIQYQQNLFNDGLRINSIYDIGNGQEPQREFQFVKVPDGQGTYRWTDYNGDGIQQIEEFEIAEYRDLAKYIRVYSNIMQYVPTNKNKLQLSLFINPSVVFKIENPLIKRVNLNFSILSQNSFLKKNKILHFNPFDLEESQMLKNQNILFTANFIRTEKSGWYSSFQWAKNQNLINANFSMENKLKNTNLWSIGYWWNHFLNFEWESKIENQENSSQLFATRNFQFNEWHLKPKISYKLSDKINAEVFGLYKNKLRIDGQEHLKSKEMTGILTYEKDKSLIRANYSFIQNDFTGNDFSVVGNQMLEGLKPGRNQVWSLLFQRTITSFIQLNINYEGRNTGYKTIHIGNMQIKANF